MNTDSVHEKKRAALAGHASPHHSRWHRAGKDADIVIWSGDSFELTTGAERVFIKGIEMSRDTRQKQLLEKYRRLPR